MTSLISANQCAEIVVIRKHLGLEVREAAELLNISIRYWQYFETGERIAPMEFISKLDRVVFLFEKIIKNIGVKEYKILPLYFKYSDFNENFSNATRYKWKLWQTLVCRLRVLGKCIEVHDNVNLNKNFKVYLLFQEFFKG